MCVSLPGKVVEIVDREQAVARVDVLGHPRLVNFMLLEDVQVGEWVLIELGLAVQRIPEADAVAWAQMLEEMTSAAGEAQVEP
jgi:hydrogenase expression/formation protein HypC